MRQTIIFAPNANVRTDRYGGPIENRARFAIEVASAISDEIGPQRTAIRISPGAPLGEVVEGEEGPDLYVDLTLPGPGLGAFYRFFKAV